MLYRFHQARCRWLTPVTLATQEAEIRSIMVQSHLGQILHETLFQKYPTQKKADGVALGVVSPKKKKKEISS
jgi:hypothetical protein